MPPSTSSISMAAAAASALILAYHGHGITAFQPSPIIPIHRQNMPLHEQHRQQRLASAILFVNPTSAAAAAQPPAPLESILDDGKGHINSELAQAIYKWELAHASQWPSENNMEDGNESTTTSSKKKKKTFSTRDGLRLVDELSREILSSLDIDIDIDDKGSSSSVSSPSSTRSAPNTPSNSGSTNISYNELVQEGMIALLRAMSTYSNYYKSHIATNNNNNNNNNIGHTNPITKPLSFEQYAKQSIHSSLLHFLASTSRPVRLPLSLQTTLQRANSAASKLRSKFGKEPTLVQVAKEVDIAPKQLALYRKLYRTLGGVGSGGNGGGKGSGTVSMEDGVETYDPSLAGVGVGLDSVRLESVADCSRNNNDIASSLSLSSTSSSSSDDSSSVSNDGLSSLSPSMSLLSSATFPEHDLLLSLNVQEDDWVTQSPERMVAPLRDILTDTEEINNPLSYIHHYLLNESLEEFLTETLSPVELEVIQLRFGLVDSKHGGRGWKIAEICERMNKEREEVVTLASVALEKLRKGAREYGDGGGEGGELMDDHHPLAYWEDDDPYVEVSL